MEIGFIRHEMQRLRVVLNFRNDYVAVNHTTTHLPSLSGAAQSLWNNQDTEWVSVSVAFRVTGKMWKMTSTHASLVKWTIRAHLVSPRNCESIQNILDGPLVAARNDGFTQTGHQLARYHCQKQQLPVNCMKKIVQLAKQSLTRFESFCATIQTRSSGEDA